VTAPQRAHPAVDPPVAARPGVGHLPPLDTRYDTDRHRRKAPLGWLPTALVLALLALLGLVALAAATAGPDEPATGTTATGSDAGSGGSRGRLTVGSTDVLQDAGTLSRVGSLAGQRATGSAVLVQSVVSDEGFWVGASSAERVFVFLTESARGTGESPFQVRAGQRVDLTGSLDRLPSGGASALGVTDAEGSTQLESQGAYVAATRVSLSS
jgi:hypothetical protein